MVYKEALGTLGAILVAVLTIGAVSTLSLRTLAAPRPLAAIVVLALVGASVLLVAVAGSKSPRWLSNPYW